MFVYYVNYSRCALFFCQEESTIVKYYMKYTVFSSVLGALYAWSHLWKLPLSLQNALFNILVGKHSP